MQSGVTCYKAGMPKPASESAKKVNMLGLKVDEPTRVELDGISEAEDRPLGYVARELMLRGLAAYRRDGHLKEPQPASTESQPGPTIKVSTVTLDKKEGQKKRA